MTDRENHFAYWVYSAVPWSRAGLQGLVLVYTIVWLLCYSADASSLESFCKNPKNMTEFAGNL